MLRTIFDQNILTSVCGGGRSSPAGLDWGRSLRGVLMVVMAMCVTTLSVFLAAHAGQSFGTSTDTSFLFAVLFASIVVAGHMLIGLMPQGVDHRLALLLALACLFFSVVVHALYIADQQSVRGYQRSPIVFKDEGQVPISELMSEQMTLERKLNRAERVPCATSCRWKEERVMLVRQEIAVASQKIKEAEARASALWTAQAASERNRSQVGIATVASAMGVPPAMLELLLAFAAAVLLEGVGCVLWTALLKVDGGREGAGTQPIHTNVSNEVEKEVPVVDLALGSVPMAVSQVAERAALARDARENGSLKGDRVEDVRTYFRCGQSEAREIAKALKLLTAAERPRSSSLSE